MASDSDSDLRSELGIKLKSEIRIRSDGSIPSSSGKSSGNFKEFIENSREFRGRIPGNEKFREFSENFRGFSKNSGNGSGKVSGKIQGIQGIQRISGKVSEDFREYFREFHGIFRESQ